MDLASFCKLHHGVAAQGEHASNATLDEPGLYWLSSELPWPLKLDYVPGQGITSLLFEFVDVQEFREWAVDELFAKAERGIEQMMAKAEDYWKEAEHGMLYPGFAAYS